MGKWVNESEGWEGEVREVIGGIAGDVEEKNHRFEGRGCRGSI